MEVDVWKSRALVNTASDNITHWLRLFIAIIHINNVSLGFVHNCQHFSEVRIIIITIKLWESLKISHVTRWKNNYHRLPQLQNCIKQITCQKMKDYRLDEVVVGQKNAAD